jgi:hypothetical protein
MKIRVSYGVHTPLSAYIAQNENQLVKSIDSHFFYSPYPTVNQKTEVRVLSLRSSAKAGAQSWTETRDPFCPIARHPPPPSSPAASPNPFTCLAHPLPLLLPVPPPPPPPPARPGAPALPGCLVAHGGAAHARQGGRARLRSLHLERRFRSRRARGGGRVALRCTCVFSSFHVTCGSSRRRTNVRPSRPVERASPICPRRREPPALGCRLVGHAVTLHAMTCRAVTRRDVPCRAVPCRAVPCRAVPCQAVPCMG